MRLPPGVSLVAAADALTLLAALGHAAGLAPFGVLVLPAYVAAAIGLSAFDAWTTDAGAARQARAAGSATLFGLIAMFFLVLLSTIEPLVLPSRPNAFHAATAGLAAIGLLVWNVRLVSAIWGARLALVLGATHAAIAAAGAAWAAQGSAWSDARATTLVAPVVVAAAAFVWLLTFVLGPRPRGASFSTPDGLGPA